MLTKSEVKGYLNRLGISEIEKPTLPYLFQLHRAHVERLSWQSLDIFAGRPASIDPQQSLSLILNGRSGYCFHLNGAFSMLLRSLGYRVAWHQAGVQPMGESPRVNGFHLALTVTLFNDQQQEERWIIDAGLGDMPYDPLPLAAGIHQQGPYTYKVMESDVVAGGWRLEHDPKATFLGVDIAPAVIDQISAFVPKHEHYSTSPESPWVNTFLLRQRHAQGSNELRGCIWAQRDDHGIIKTELRTQSQWLDVLGDVFGETMVAYDMTDRDAIWSKVRLQHEEWKHQMNA
ncbi:arylamine N-acetyltransferase family protein [Paenibacillus paeoniae]